MRIGVQCSEHAACVERGDYISSVGPALQCPAFLDLSGQIATADIHPKRHRKYVMVAIPPNYSHSYVTLGETGSFYEFELNEARSEEHVDSSLSSAIDEDSDISIRFLVLQLLQDTQKATSDQTVTNLSPRLF